MNTSTHTGHDLSTRRSSDVLDGQKSTVRRQQVVGINVGPGGAAVLTTTLRPSSTRVVATDLAARRPLNLVAKPLAATRIVRAVPEGALMTRIGASSNGYANVVFDGCRGYAPLESLVRAACGSDGGRELEAEAKAPTTADVELRALPNLGADVRGVIPAGATIRHDRQLVNGFLEVDFQGTWGWVWIDRLT